MTVIQIDIGGIKVLKYHCSSNLESRLQSVLQADTVISRIKKNLANGGVTTLVLEDILKGCLYLDQIANGSILALMIKKNYFNVCKSAEIVIASVSKLVIYSAQCLKDIQEQSRTKNKKN